MYLFVYKFYLIVGKQVKLIIKLLNRNLFLLITMWVKIYVYLLHY